MITRRKLLGWGLGMLPAPLLAKLPSISSATDCPGLSGPLVVGVDMAGDGYRSSTAAITLARQGDGITRILDSWVADEIEPAVIAHKIQELVNNHGKKLCEVNVAVSSESEFHEHCLQYSLGIRDLLERPDTFPFQWPGA